MVVQDNNGAQKSIPSPEGIFAIAKPLGISSQKAVQIVKHWARRESGDKKIRVGHAGTLDPLATGVLVIAVGRTYTRQLEDIVQKDKHYSAEITLGVTTTTGDAEGERTTHTVEQIPSLADVEKVTQSFVGTIKQTPPLFSAAKIRGEEGYKRARRGEIFDPGAHDVEIMDNEVLSYEYPVIKINVTTGPGVYIRSLARDIGSALGTGGFMSKLVRTRVGQFHLKDATELSIYEHNHLKKER